MIEFWVTVVAPKNESGLTDLSMSHWLIWIQNLIVRCVTLMNRKHCRVFVAHIQVFSAIYPVLFYQSSEEVKLDADLRGLCIFFTEVLPEVSFLWIGISGDAASFENSKTLSYGSYEQRIKLGLDVTRLYLISPFPHAHTPLISFSSLSHINVRVFFTLLVFLISFPSITTKELVVCD